MLSEFRDVIFTTAWFGLMTMVWCGWAQESPARGWRVPLIVGSVAGVLLAAGFGVWTGLSWGMPTALEGRYATFGVVVAAEVLAAGVGALVLVRRGQSRWIAWWVAMVVAVHFLSLSGIFGGWVLTALAIVQVVGLAALVAPLRRTEAPTSRWVGPLMGVTIFAAALVLGVGALVGAA
ncbi:hypothetical protein SGUI_2082 [Serinicoccus hydrothermalis]|uniref:Integral membrane protein n=1 Tax=Serinicoccus hydrothermalis TaxID=1758689 RepID=A0A1B1NDF6_9MICO|nr:hypothetical protein [Serinicoccus hydrothermalis]ANS79478.1 hypothetical protein SGUI_2082 [Serinicoccus hydrothermalis]